MEFFRKLFGSKPRDPGPLRPESDYIAEYDEDEVRCFRPDGTTEKVAWADLTRIYIMTTGDGPTGCDWYWIFEGKESGCAVPQGAAGEDLLLERIQALPDFNNQAILDAAPSTSHATFICWQRGNT